MVKSTNVTCLRLNDVGPIIRNNTVKLRQLSASDVMINGVSNGTIVGTKNIKIPGNLYCNYTLLPNNTNYFQIQYTVINSVTLTIVTSQTVIVDWGDGTIDNLVTHMYNKPGTYIIGISTQNTNIVFNNSFLSNVTALPYLGTYTNVNSMFRNTNFNLSLSSWNTSNVTNLASMFLNATSFNSPIFNDVNNVTTMSGMFINATVFNQDISFWNTINVTNMTNMFAFATSFNSPIFNNTINVTNMNSMFSGATDFNQDISSWNTSNVLSMVSMFLNATNFNRDISSWNINKVISMVSMFNNSGLSNTNYNKILIGWSSQSPRIGVPLGANNNTATGDGLIARNILINTYGWVITDATPP